MYVVKEAQCRIVAYNQRNQDEVKQNAIQANSVKGEACIIKWGISYDNIITTVANICSDTNTTDNSTNYALQNIIPLYSDTLKDASFHLGVNISDLLD